MRSNVRDAIKHYGGSGCFARVRRFNQVPALKQIDIRTNDTDIPPVTLSRFSAPFVSAPGRARPDTRFLTSLAQLEASPSMNRTAAGLASAAAALLRPEVEFETHLGRVDAAGRCD
jgi:hypothetical protein